VLTAHPTRFRRSLLEAERSIAQRCSRMKASKASALRKQNELLLAPASRILWQTRLLRYARLTVPTRSENALSFYRDDVCSRFRASMPNSKITFPANGSTASSAWDPGSGGDRDGNLEHHAIRSNSPCAPVRGRATLYLTEDSPISAGSFHLTRLVAPRRS